MLMPLELIQRMYVGLRAGDHHVFVDAVSDHATFVFFDRHRNLTLRIQPRRHSMNLILHEFAARRGQI